MAGAQPLSGSVAGSDAAPPPPGRRGGGAGAIAGGILLSRIAGFLRERATGYFFGVGPHADVLNTALRAPNLLQNLLGEQTLSAAFIPVYSRLLAAGRRREAARFAGVALGLLVVAGFSIALAGVLLARPLVGLFAAGYLRDAALVAAGEATVDRFELAVEAVRWVFPGTAILVLSAWALGVRNSHGRFFLSYAAPVLWNGAILAALVAVAWRAGFESPEARARLVVAACIGAIVGGVLQLLVQLPAVVRDLGGLPLGLSLRAEGVREALRAFGPAVAGRGVVQLSAYLDQFLASLLTAGAVGAVAYAQRLYLLPVALFGMSIAAAALPDLSRRTGSGVPAGELTAVLGEAVARAGFLVLPSAVALSALALPLVAGFYQTGRFGGADVALVAAVLAVYALGLPASTGSRILQSGYFALGDTRSPARRAAERVILSTLVAVPAMWWLDGVAVDRAPWVDATGAGRPLAFGAVGLALGSTLGAWYELARLRAGLARRLAPLGRGRALARQATAALLALSGGLAAWWLGARQELGPVALGVSVALAYGAGYLAIARLLGVPELGALWSALRARISRARDARPRA